MIHSIKETFRDTIFLKKVTVIALPIALQGLLNSIVNLVDNLMIGQLGETSIAAVGLANKVFFVFSLLVFGVCSGSSVLSAQFWGKQNIKDMKKVLGMALLIVVTCSILFALPAVLNPELVMRIFTTSQATIAEGAKYLTVAAFTYPLIAVSNAYGATLRAANRVKAPMFISFGAIVINIICNYVLIFGKFGAPVLGVAGAAAGTVIARSFEVITILIVSYVTKSPAAAKIKELFYFKKDFVILFFTTAAPVIANEFMWGLGTAIYSLAYGRMGDGAVAAITVASTITDLLIVFFQGTSNACAIILGNLMGANRLDAAEDYGRKFIWVQLFLSIVVAIIMVGTRWWFIGLFNVTDTVAHDISKCILMFGLFMPMKMFNYVNVVGILRSGGDTKYCLFLDCSGIWILAIPLAFIGGLVLKLPIYIVFGMVMLEEVYKFFLGIHRYKQKKWLKNLTIN